MKTITLLVVLLIATPAVAQSRLYTNDDLGRPLSPNRATATPEQLAGLKAREFHLPVVPAAPDVWIVPHDPTWPFRTSTADAIAEPFFKPWMMSAYVGRGYGGRFGRGDNRPARDPEPGPRRSATRTPPLRPARAAERLAIPKLR